MNINTILNQISMNQLTNPAIDFDKSLGVLSTVISLGVQCSGRREFTAMCIVNAIKSPMQCGEIISTVKSMIEDNEAGMRNILGNELTNRIIAL